MAVVGNPLNQADVQRALGVGSSVNKWSQLCTHANINKWSAYKPIYHSKITRLTDAERAAGRTVSGYLVSWGMMKRISSAWSDFMDNYGEIKSFPWIYDKPVWDGTSKFRITDFIGYNSDVRRLVAVSFSSWDLWLPSATGSVGYSLWAQLTGLSTVISEAKPENNIVQTGFEQLNKQEFYNFRIIWAEIQEILRIIRFINML